MCSGDVVSGQFSLGVVAPLQDMLLVFAEWVVVGIGMVELRAFPQQMVSPGCLLGRGCSVFLLCLPVFSIALVGVVGG